MVLKATSVNYVLSVSPAMPAFGGKIELSDDGNVLSFKICQNLYNWYLNSYTPGSDEE